MKKLILILALLSPILAFGQNRPVMIGDTNRPGVYKTSPLLLNTNNWQLTLPGSLSGTNGMTISGGTVNFTGISTFTIPNDKVSSSAVSGKQTTSGVGDAGQVVKLNSSGVVDSSMYTAGSVSKYAFRTNLTADVTCPSAGTFTNVLSCTSTLGSNSLVRVTFQSQTEGYEHVARITAPGFQQVDSLCGAGSGNGFSMCVMEGIQTSNTVFTAWVNSRGGSSDHVKGPTAAYNGSCVATNATWMFISEIK